MPAFLPRTFAPRPAGRRLGAATLAAAALTLGGCASFNDLRSEVTAFSQWPGGRQPGTYVFERLPSQQANGEQQQRLEDAARASVEAAGFKPADSAANAAFTVQLGARVDVNERSLYDDPFWWHGGLYRSRFGGGYGGGFGIGFGGGRAGFGPWGWRTPTYEREVAVLIRDRATGTPLYEARASNDGGSPSMNSLLGAMYAAAMKDFPNAVSTPHIVVTPITQTTP